MTDIHVILHVQTKWVIGLMSKFRKYDKLLTYY